MSLNSQIFQNSGVWRCPLDVTRILVVAAGGGGGGGGAVGGSGSGNEGAVAPVALAALAT